MWAVAHALTALQVHALGSCGLEETPCLLASLQGFCVLTSSCKGSRHQALPTSSSYQFYPALFRTTDESEMTLWEWEVEGRGFKVLRI